MYLKYLKYIFVNIVYKYIHITKCLILTVNFFGDEDTRFKFTHWQKSQQKQQERQHEEENRQECFR